MGFKIALKLLSLVRSGYFDVKTLLPRPPPPPHGQKIYEDEEGDEDGNEDGDEDEDEDGDKDEDGDGDGDGERKRDLM